MIECIKLGCFYLCIQSGVLVISQVISFRNLYYSIGFGIWMSSMKATCMGPIWSGHNQTDHWLECNSISLHSVEWYLAINHLFPLILLFSFFALHQTRDTFNLIGLSIVLSGLSMLAIVFHQCSDIVSLVQHVKKSPLGQGVATATH